MDYIDCKPCSGLPLGPCGHPVRQPAGPGCSKRSVWRSAGRLGRRRTGREEEGGSGSAETHKGSGLGLGKNG
ncbi:unnamed protein product, partial [Boreogadus saida]